MESLWEQTWEKPDFPSQDGDMNTDVLIIVGGMAGILCAHQLHCAGVPYVLAEAETICSGITKNTTAKITSQHGLIYDKLISRFGVEQAKQYLDANEAALQTYRELCRNIDCGFEEKAAYTYSLDDRRKIERELEALDKLGFPAEFVDKLPPVSYTHLDVYKRQVSFSAASAQMVLVISCIVWMPSKTGTKAGFATTDTTTLLL